MSEEDKPIEGSDNTEIGYVKNRKITEEMEGSYIDYAMSVIISRALPDVRDGLKPVQRRILYSMDSLNLGAGGSFKKSASVVGECFVKDTMILTERGLVPIQKVEEGDRVWSTSEGKFVPVRKFPTIVGEPVDEFWHVITKADI